MISPLQIVLTKPASLDWFGWLFTFVISLSAFLKYIFLIAVVFREWRYKREYKVEDQVCKLSLHPGTIGNTYKLFLHPGTIEDTKLFLDPGTIGDTKLSLHPGTIGHTKLSLHPGTIGDTKLSLHPGTIGDI